MQLRLQVQTLRLVCLKHFTFGVENRSYGLTLKLVLKMQSIND